MSVLTVALASVRLLCGYTDASQDGGIAALIALQQPALEYAIDPAVLAFSASDAGLNGLLTLGVTELIAGAYVAAQGRGIASQGLLTAQTLNSTINALASDNDGASKFQQQTFKIATLEVSTRPLFDNFRPEVTKTDLVRLGQDLAAAGLARLTPFLRSARSLARTASGSDANIDDQAPVPLLLGAGTPADATFDAVLGTDGQAEPTGVDDVTYPFFGEAGFGFLPGREP